MLYDKIKEMMKVSMKAKDKETLGAVRIIKAEIDRDPNKDYSDENVIAIMNRLNKMTEKHPTPDKVLLGVINGLLPTVSEDEIKHFVKAIDFSKLKNKMQAMGIVKNHFKGKMVDSKMLQELIKGM